MKTRKSFVSNSSSSSFVIQVKEDWLEAGRTTNLQNLINSEQRATLIEYGFEYIHTRCPDQIEHGGNDIDPDDSEYPFIYMYKSVGCNQDDIAKLLIDLDIPFRASVHYGHEAWIWNPEIDLDIVIIQNYGSAALLYGLESNIFQYCPVPQEAIRKMKREQL